MVLNSSGRWELSGAEGGQRDELSARRGAALSDCQEEVSSIWETLRQDSRKIRFQGSLFDLCSPSCSPSVRLPLAALILPLVLVLTGPNWAPV
ncbi:hypothetical protein GOODEAATRI_009800 [Goodea atripinnis]|uniref:Uncharacterized protein n=1 Tax=Goodea atripinnis TaxID=208336 RepID=A0ABV0PWR1_9TELE